MATESLPSCVTAVSPRPDIHSKRPVNVRGQPTGMSFMTTGSVCPGVKYQDEWIGSMPGPVMVNRKTACPELSREESGRYPAGIEGSLRRAEPVPSPAAAGPEGFSDWSHAKRPKAANAMAIKRKGLIMGALLLRFRGEAGKDIGITLKKHHLRGIRKRCVLEAI